MKYSICCYFDTDLEKFLPCFVVPQSKEEVVEGIHDAAKKGKIDDAASKKTYFLGVFDTANAKIDLIEKPEMIADLTIYGKTA